MAAVAAVVAGVAATAAVPVIALHEIIVKRHKAQCKKHLPAPKKRVSFTCQMEAAEAVHACAARDAAEKKRVAAALIVEQRRKAAEAEIAARVPVLKPALRSRRVSPPPAYEEEQTATTPAIPAYATTHPVAELPTTCGAAVREEENKLSGALAHLEPRPCVRFAARA